MTDRRHERYGITRVQYARRAFIGTVVITATFFVAGVASTYLLDGWKAWAAVALAIFGVWIGHGAMMNAYHDWQRIKPNPPASPDR